MVSLTKPDICLILIRSIFGTCHQGMSHLLPIMLHIALVLFVHIPYGTVCFKLCLKPRRRHLCCMDLSLFTTRSYEHAGDILRAPREELL